MELVESGRSFAKMEERKRRRQEEEDSVAVAGNSNAAGKPIPPKDTAGRSNSSIDKVHKRIRRQFRQSRPVADVGGGGSAAASMDSGVLMAVFGQQKPNKRGQG